MTPFSSYATYVRGLEDLEGPIHGWLTLGEDGLRFESFEKKSALAALLPEDRRPRSEHVEIVIPRAELGRITDLDGSLSPKRRRLLGRILSWLNVEPNGMQIEWQGRTLVFDCERPVEAALSGPADCG